MPYHYICPKCGAAFTKKNAGRRFCSQACAWSMYAKKLPAYNRLLSKRIVSGECWLYTGALSATGYGLFQFDGYKTTAHVAAWLLLRGPIPQGLQVLHNCPTGDNPACFNPDHLWLGTQAENMADMASKGRAGQSRLTPAIVRAIRARYAAGGVRQQDLAAEYGVDQTAISCVLLRKTWKHVT